MLFESEEEVCPSGEEFLCSLAILCSGSTRFKSGITLGDSNPTGADSEGS